MVTQNPLLKPHPRQNKPFRLELTLEGCFLIGLSVGQDGDTITGVNVYAPDCGHIYSGGIPGQWNNPYTPCPNPPKASLLFMLQPRQYCLEIDPASGLETKGKLTLSGLQQSIGQKNIWPEASRPLGLGWDLSVKLPVPDDVNCWSTESMAVGDSFAGRASTTVKNIGMSQKLTYNNITDFTLRGSPLPLADYEVHDEHADRKVEFKISTEPPCIPSIEHQRMAVEVMAEMLGLDLNLKNPLQPMTHEHHIMNTQGGSCMGGGIFHQPAPTT